MHYYKNNEMFPTCKKEHSLKKENYLSEFVTTNLKEFARDNLGITDIINSLDKKIDAKVIEFEGIAWDLIPTEGNTEKVLSSDAIYKALSLYVTSKEIESIEGGLLKLVKDSSDALDLELNKAVESLLDKIQCLKLEFAKYTTQINSIIKAFRSGGIFNVSLYLQLAQSLDYIVKLTLLNAVNNAPDIAKNAGQIITFLDTENVWQQYQYQSDTIDDWDNLLKWKNLNDSSSAPIEEGAHIYNISEYLPGGAKYGQLIGAGVYTIYGDITPVSQYRTIFGWDPDLGEVNNPAEKDTSLVIKEIDTDDVTAYEYYVFVGNDINGYGYQTTLNSNEDEVPEWISKAFGDVNSLINVVANKLDAKKVDKEEGKSLSANDFTDNNVSELADSINSVSYNSTNKKLIFTKNNNTTIEVDATDFIKDGMVSSVSIEDENLVITFNTDSGKEAIIIPLIDIFNPANYYTKTDIDGKLVPATTTALGLVKLYNTNGANKSGLLVQEDGGLLINTSSKDGLYIDNLGQLKANIKGVATDAEIEAGTSTEKAITPSNLSKVKESFGLATVATSGSYNDLEYKPTIPINTSELNNDSGFLTEHQDISGKQDVLVSGTNIKTINNASIVGEGNLDVGTVTGIIVNNVTKTPTNGTVDLGTVLTSTTSSVTNGSTTPITSGGVYNALQNYETKLVFTTSSSIASYTATRNQYCRFTNELSTIDISLPTSSLVAGDTCAFNFTTRNSFSDFTISGGIIKKMKDFAIKANGTYEVVALYDGIKWLVTVTEFE